LVAALAGGAPAAGAGAGPAAGGVAGVGHAAAAGMAQQGAQRGPMATFDSLLAAYLAYLALADDVARATFLRERVGFKATTGETFKEGPGGLAVFARLFDAVLRVATTGMVGRYYGLSEDLGLANFLGVSKATPWVWLALPLLTRHLLITQHFVCMGLCCRCCARIFRPGQPSCGGRRVTSLCSRKDLARAGLSLCGFLTCNVLLPSLLRTNSTGSRGLISPHGAGSSRFWRTRHSTRTRRDGSRG